MNVILFPYDEESEILIRYSKMLNNLTIRGLLAPSGFGTCGKTVQGDTMTYIIKNHVEEIEGMDVEALFLVDSLHTIETSVLIEQVEICAKKGLSILVGRELKQEENSIIANICFKYNTRLLKCDDVNSFIVNDNILELHDVHTPIIAVMGSGNRCNKFELQIEFKKQLEKKV